ncbi:mucin-2-like [Rhinophrynus dorsalis]
MRFQTTSICVLLMALTISSGYEVIPGREPNHVHDVCSTWGHFHYKTFDGDFYQFPGLCTYNLASDYRNHEFSVHIKRSTDTGQPLIKKIIATIKDIVIQMNSSSILVNEIEAELPYNNFGIFVEDTDVYLKMSTKIGLTLMWNKEDAIMLELQTKFRNVTRGLCGDYNGVPIYNEFITGGNRLTPSDFGNQQNVDDPSETCFRKGKELTSRIFKGAQSAKNNLSDFERALKITVALQGLRARVENVVIKEQKLSKVDFGIFLFQRSVCEQNLGHSAFSECIDILDTESYIQACMLDMCSCNQSQIQDMSCLCSTVTEYSRQCSHAGGKPGNWRTDSLCHKQCPLNMVFQESTSPCMSTCSHLAFPTLCTEHNIDGCFCPDGTVYDDYKRAGCVPISECSCISEGILYSTGQTMQRGCQKCHCISGTWSCIKQDCPGVCSIEGGAHFTTFDGKKYTFHGNCLYVLSKGIGVESYNIIGELSMCSYPQRATCLKSIILRDNATNTITFQANGHVLFNYQRITLPYITGLCGDFNSNANDDFVTYGGLVEATASAFANTWKADDMCPDQKEIHEDPCSLSIENKNYAEHWCSFLENKYSIFAKCHSAVPPQEYAKQCRYDSCNCKDSEPCMCAALSSYVQACAANGIILRDWKIGICDKYVSSCPLSQVYRYDITKRQPKCNSLAERGKVEDIEFIPVDGCGCPAGKYLNEKNQCVSISECSCYENGIYTNPLGIIMKGDQFCSCHNGKLACNTTSNRYQTCSPGKVYFDCNTQLETYTASVYRTCKTLGVENMKCSSGCVCPNELLDDGLGGCVPKDRCSCPHNNDMIPHGKTIKQDCNTCLCQSGHWNCTRYECYGTCTVYGSGHYITFDTRFYEFDGNCEFELAQDYCGNDFSQGSFRVITENIPCGTTGVTCSKAIRVILGNKELKLAEKHLQETQGEGEKSVQYLTREVGIYLVIEASNGILLIWDRKTSIIIKLPPKFKSKVCGLCGNFDDDSNNDFTTRQMLQVTSITEYGNSWKVNPACPDSVPEIHPCKMASHREAWAMKQCSLIKSDVFKVCHSKVDPAPFYEACVNDACSCDTGGDCECFCTVVAVYAQKCNQADVCVHWRTPDICPIFCDYYNPDEEACEWHYHACGNHKIQTCQYINNINTNVNITFLEGCYPTCPPDKPIFDEEKKICVTKEECGCYIYNTRYKPNEKVPTNNNSCYCMVNGTRYNQHDIISKKSEAGICIVEICINGSISHNITICTTTTESITTTTAITQSVTSMTVSITPEIPSTTSFTEEATPTSIINTSLLLPTSTPVESTTSSATTTQSITTETTSVTTEIPSTSASTEFTTEETTQTSIVSTVPLSPTSTPMENTTTPITVTQSVTTVTVSETPESSSTTPSISKSF